jgi:hypothetical protein
MVSCAKTLIVKKQNRLRIAIRRFMRRRITLEETDILEISVLSIKKASKD